MAKNIASMSISLPRELKQYVYDKTQAEHYGTPSDYIRSLIRGDLKRGQQELLERKLLEGLALGPAVPMAKAEWGKIKNQIKKHA